MASSSCALNLRGAALPSRSRLAGGNRSRRDPLPAITWRRRRWCTRATLRAAHAEGNERTTGLPSASCPKASFPDAMAAAAMVYVNRMEAEETFRREAISPEKLDQWMRESIGQIVRNIGEAPFLMHIFSDGGRGGGEPALRLERETASPGSWPGIKKRWDKESRTPDAVILVEELGEEEKEEEEVATAASIVRRVPTTWGLVVQGRGMDCVACYILNTTRVKSSVGFCTHFCLVRAKCFGEPVEAQLRNAWLQGR